MNDYPKYGQPEKETTNMEKLPFAAFKQMSPAEQLRAYNMAVPNDRSDKPYVGGTAVSRDLNNVGWFDNLFK